MTTLSKLVWKQFDLVSFFPTSSFENVRNERRDPKVFSSELFVSAVITTLFALGTGDRVNRAIPHQFFKGLLGDSAGN